MAKLLDWLRNRTEYYVQLRWDSRLALDLLRYLGKTAYHGTEYGGWSIIPSMLSEQAVVYSFGVGEDASFDLEIIARYGAEVHAFDPTPRSIQWVKRRTWPPRFHFHPFGIGDSDRMATFFPPKDPNHVSHSILPSLNTHAEAIQVQLFRLRTIAEMLGHKDIDVLKMDIEGAEYEVIEDLLRTPEIRAQQLLVEFHHFTPSGAFENTRVAIEKLLAADYRVFSISKRGYEYGFVRR